MFSPKVLDRANVIEFRVTESEMDSFLSDLRKPDLSTLDGKGSGYGRAFVQAASNPDIAVADEIKDRFFSEMNLFFALQHEHGGEYGFRIAYETARFLHFYKLLGKAQRWQEKSDSQAEVKTGWVTKDTKNRDWFDAAFDGVVIQKFLPKLHGSKVKLGPLLKKMYTACIQPQDGARRTVQTVSENAVEPSRNIPSDARYPVSAEKIFRMWRQLNENGFTSFPEN
jgi:5-methylcytosine-specific restriction protein B